MQNKGMDPNLVAALMNGNNNRNGFGGDGCWWIWIILLFFCWGGFGGNGFGNNGANGLPAQLNNDAGRELLMNAIQGNGAAINQLAASLNCSTTQLQGAICSLQGSVDKIGGQIGMSGQQIINSIQSMGCQIGNQIAECCCNVRQDIVKMGYENQLATINQTNALQSTANTQFNIIERRSTHRRRSSTISSAGWKKPVCRIVSTNSAARTHSLLRQPACSTRLRISSANSKPRHRFRLTWFRIRIVATRLRWPLLRLRFADALRMP